MASDLKQTLHKLIDSCNDEFLLEEARSVLESPQTGKDFLEELDDEDRDSFLEGEDEHDKDFNQHRLLHKLDAWKKK